MLANITVLCNNFHRSLGIPILPMIIHSEAMNYNYLPLLSTSHFKTKMVEGGLIPKWISTFSFLITSGFGAFKHFFHSSFQQFIL